MSGWRTSLGLGLLLGSIVNGLFVAMWLGIVLMLAGFAVLAPDGQLGRIGQRHRSGS